MLFLHIAVIGFVVYFQIGDVFPGTLPLLGAIMMLEFPTFLGILHVLNRRELAKGPLLEVDKTMRVLTLLRDNKKIEYDDIDAIFVLVGWQESQGWEHVAEMSLIVGSDESRLESIPVILHNDTRTAKELAERLATMTGKTVWTTKLAWSQRQKRARDSQGD